MIEIIFILSIFLTFYAYFGYPFSLYIIGILFNNKLDNKIYYPNVTLIITVYNEEKLIKDKLENILLIQYPNDNFQVIIASDGSTDKTIDIAKKYENDVIEILDIKKRAGKENAQKEAVKIAKGEIFIFSDVATMLDPTGIVQIVSNFSDPSVGGVSSEDRLIGKDGKVSGEGFYVRYEMWLRGLESRCNTLVGLSGSFFAARRIICEDFSGNMQSDFRTVLNCVKLGLRCVSDPRAIGYYLDVKGNSNEFDRKVRTVLRGLTVYFNHLEFLNVFKYGLFSYQYLCHKLLRWLVPVFLCIAFLSNVYLSFGSLLFLSILLLQSIFYIIGLYGWIYNIESSMKVIKIPKYFLMVNASIFIAWWKFIRGHRVILWNPSER